MHSSGPSSTSKPSFAPRPERIVSDLHPRYLSSRWATEHADGLQHLRVQHHHAHIAAVMAEHGLDGRSPVIGFSFDGTGYGTDGAIWGGEVLLADYHGFRRLAHLAYVPLPGGDAAIKRPYRIALAHLWAAGVPWTPDLPPVDACPEAGTPGPPPPARSGYQHRADQQHGPPVRRCRRVGRNTSNGHVRGTGGD